jgi:hypothetical protein
LEETKDGVSQNGMITSAFAQIFNDELHQIEEHKAVFVHRPVAMVGLNNIHDTPSWMHTAILFPDRDIWGYYDDGRVRLDPQYDNNYTVMSDEDTEKMFGVKNGFDSEKMQEAFDTQRQKWDNILNPNALDYHAKSFFPFWPQHNCNDFINAVVQTYQNI